MSISADLIKKLRDLTGAGVLDCRKALDATQGDIDKAVAMLREKGLIVEMVTLSLMLKELL